MISSVIPARLEFSCGHAALVSLPRLKGESAAQRTERVNTEKSGARGRACDFCGPREPAMVEVRDLQQAPPAVARSGERAKDEVANLTHRSETTPHGTQANGRAAANPSSRQPAVRPLQPVTPRVQAPAPAGPIAPTVPARAPAPAEPSAPVTAVGPAPVVPAVLPEPAKRTVLEVPTAPALAPRVSRRAGRRAAVAEPTRIRARRLPTTIREEGVRARAVPRPTPLRTRRSTTVDGSPRQRFQIRFAAETIIRAPDMRAALRQLDSLGATDIVSIVLTPA